VRISLLKLLLIGLMVAALHTWVFGTADMLSDSMAPTLRATWFWQDLVLIDRLSLNWRDPRRGEVLHIHLVIPEKREDELVCKRVAALPGERFEVREGRVLVNGSPVNPAPGDDGATALRDLRYTNEGHASPGAVLEVASQAWFVLGDNSFDSFDSRYWGAVSRENIRGVAAMVLWPTHRFGRLCWKDDERRESR